MAHLPELAEIHPGPASIGHGQPMALVEAGAPLKGIQLREKRPANGIELASNPPLRGDGHRKRAQVVEAGALQPDPPQTAGPLETAMVGPTPFEGAVNKEESFLLGDDRSNGGVQHRLRRSPEARTLVIMIAISTSP
jgi:hypothetical protein